MSISRALSFRCEKCETQWPVPYTGCPKCEDGKEVVGDDLDAELAHLIGTALRAAVGKENPVRRH